MTGTAEREGASLTVVPGGAAQPGGGMRVQLPTFEGPLHLLLHLIQQQELDIFDIPVARVLDAYLETLEAMKRLDLEIAGEFLVMAATLAWLKSRLLLPQEERPDEEAEELDPRLDLARRLFELRQFQEVGRQLKDRDWLGRDVYVRRHPAREVQVEEAGLLEVDLFALIAALDRVLRRAELRQPLAIEKRQVPLRSRLPWLLELVGNRRQVTFDEAFADVRSRQGVVVTFLAMLELARLHLVRIFQAGPGSVIHLEAAYDDLEAARAVVAEVLARGELGAGADPGQEGER